jgi:hypothetical protein
LHSGSEAHSIEYRSTDARSRQKTVFVIESVMDTTVESGHGGFSRRILERFKDSRFLRWDEAMINMSCVLKALVYEHVGEHVRHGPRLNGMT